MYTASAEQLWSKITEHVTNGKYSIEQTLLGLDTFIKTFQTASPRLSKVITLDAVVSHLVAIYSTNGSRKNDHHHHKSSNSAAEASGADFSITSGSSSTEMSIILAPPNEALEDCENDDELANELVSKLLDAFEIIKDCIL